MNRAKALVLALFAAYWVAVVVILVAARDVYDDQLAQVVRPAGDQRPAEIGALLVLTALLAVLSFGVIRGWRWIFWLILIAYLAGILHVLVSALELIRIVASQDPAWYIVLQAVVGLIQFIIALVMLTGYRKAACGAIFDCGLLPNHPGLAEAHACFQLVPRSGPEPCALVLCYTWRSGGGGMSNDTTTAQWYDVSRVTDWLLVGGEISSAEHMAWLAEQGVTTVISAACEVSDRQSLRAAPAWLLSHVLVRRPAT